MKAAVLCVLSLLLLSGCGAGLPQARELGGMSLMRTMGVDFKEDGAVSITVTTAHQDEDTSGKEKPVILSAKRKTLSGACQALRSRDEEGVFLGHVEELLLGEELAAQGGAEEILRYLADDQQLGLGLRVWLVRGEEAQTVLGNKDNENTVQQRLEELPVELDLGIPGMERNAGGVLTALLEGRAAWLPALALVGEGEERSVLIWGYGVLDGDGLCGWVTGDAARGLELACGYPGNELLELEQGTVRLRAVTLDCIPVLEGEVVKGLRLELRLTGQIEELLGDASTLQMQVEEQTLRYLRAAVKQAQQENRDFLGLDMLAGISAPEVCDQIRAQWPDRFAELEIDIYCKATMIERRK